MTPPSAHTRFKGYDRSTIGLCLGRRYKKVTKQSKNRVAKSQRKSQKDIIPICSEYLKERCEQGSTCKYAHPPVCRDFLRGKCTRKCKYIHPTDQAVFEYHCRMLEIEWDEKIKEKEGGKPMD